MRILVLLTVLLASSVANAYCIMLTLWDGSRGMICGTKATSGGGGGGGVWNGDGPCGTGGPTCVSCGHSAIGGACIYVCDGATDCGEVIGSNGHTRVCSLNSESCWSS